MKKISLRTYSFLALCCAGGLAACNGSRVEDPSPELRAAQSNGNGVIPEGCPVPIDYTDIVVSAQQPQSCFSGVPITSQEEAIGILKSASITCEANMTNKANGVQNGRRTWVDENGRERGSLSYIETYTSKLVNINYQTEHPMWRESAAELTTNGDSGSTYTYYEYLYQTITEKGADGKDFAALQETIAVYENGCPKQVVNAMEMPTSYVTNVYAGESPDYSKLILRKANGNTYVFGQPFAEPSKNSSNPSVTTREVSVKLNEDEMKVVGVMGDQIRVARQRFSGNRLTDYAVVEVQIGDGDDRDFFGCSYFDQQTKTIPVDGQCGVETQVSEFQRKCGGTDFETTGTISMSDPETVAISAIAGADCNQIVNSSEALASCGGEASGYCVFSILPKTKLPGSPDSDRWNIASPSNPLLDLRERF